MNKAEWYVDWFNSPYYHLLYNHRNDEEANLFTARLCDYLSLQPPAQLWDIACGKGRHAIALNKRGFNVTGTDLSKNSICEAKEACNDMLHFFEHDMRHPFKINAFDAAFNLFTSIGYFENEDDNYKVFKHVADSLKPKGLFIIDFLNSTKVATSIKSSYQEIRGNITFDISKQIKNNTIYKRIEFSSEGRKYYFEESVRLFTKEDFLKFSESTDLKLGEVFGDYLLHPFVEETSDRLILIFKK